MYRWLLLRARAEWMIRCYLTLRKIINCVNFWWVFWCFTLLQIAKGWTFSKLHPTSLHITYIESESALVIWAGKIEHNKASNWLCFTSGVRTFYYAKWNVRYETVFETEYNRTLLPASYLCVFYKDTKPSHNTIRFKLCNRSPTLCNKLDMEWRNYWCGLL